MRVQLLHRKVDMQSRLLFNSTQLEQFEGGALVSALGTGIEKCLIGAYLLFKNFGEPKFTSNTKQSASVVLKECSEEENDFAFSGSDDSFKGFVDNIDVFVGRDE